MTTFISHKREDLALARACGLQLLRLKIPRYLDDDDKSLVSVEDITAHFLEKINGASHLLAVIFPKTKGSWWVPFEIGAASAINKRICSVVIGEVEQPDFLSKWPRLTLNSQRDWDSFAEAYRQDVSSGGKILDSTYPSIASAPEFHRKLKQALGQ